MTSFKLSRQGSDVISDSLLQQFVSIQKNMKLKGGGTVFVAIPGPNIGLTSERRQAKILSTTINAYI